MGKTYFNWSSGKDSALALYKMQLDATHIVSKLITTVNTDYNRVSMHGLRIELLEQQAKAIGIPLTTILLDGKVSMEEYDQKMQESMQLLISEEYEYAVFGDIFLEDLKAYREKQLTKVGMQSIFPLWKQDTKALLLEFLSLGFKAITVCVNAKMLDASFCGRVLDKSFIADLPEGVDPCGENGEFHTFVFDGPNFSNPIDFSIGETILRKYTPSGKDDDCFSEDTAWDHGFWYCDLVPSPKKETQR